MENKTEQIIKGMQFSQTMLNSITVTGVDNCNKLTVVYNNIAAFLNMVQNGEVSLTDDLPDELK